MITEKQQYKLDPKEINEYRQNGFVLLKSVFTKEEAAYLRSEAHAIADRFHKLLGYESVNAAWHSASKVAEGKRVVLHCHNAQYHSSSFNQVLTDSRLMDRMADLIGPNIQLHHTKMFIKPPENGAPFPLHQDYPYFPHEKHTMTAAIIHLDDAPEIKGCVRVVPGSHKLGPLKHNSDGGWHLSVEDYPLESAKPIPASAGDVVVFNYLTIHGSGINASDEPRTTFLIQMRDPADTPTEAVHLSRGQGVMLRGYDPTSDAGITTDSPSRYLESVVALTPR